MNNPKLPSVLAGGAGTMKGSMHTRPLFGSSLGHSRLDREIENPKHPMSRFGAGLGNRLRRRLNERRFLAAVNVYAMDAPFRERRWRIRKAFDLLQLQKIGEPENSCRQYKCPLVHEAARNQNSPLFHQNFFKKLKFSCCGHLHGWGIGSIVGATHCDSLGRVPCSSGK
jgi:hypothetical protein